MSTRATVHFQYGDGETAAIVYRHSDGYPEGLGEDLKKFFEDVRKQATDTRFGDPSYLAAKFVVWQAWQYARKSERPLDFISVGIVLCDPEDISYRYKVRCIYSDDFPSIQIEEMT